MILVIKPNKRCLLQVCFPSLRQDHRTLMTFLPHILLHALLDGNHECQQEIFKEFNAVIESLNTKKVTPLNLNVGVLIYSYF